MIKLSIVIPAYNEEQRIGRTLEKIIEYIKKRKLRAEIIIVDDGSTDATSSVVQSVQKKHPRADIHHLFYTKNKGKGYAVKEGMRKAKGDWILLTDSDLATPIEELDRFLKYRTSDIIIGSRAMHDSNVQTLLHKKLLGRIGNLLISLLAVKGVKDTQCGFKLFKGSVAKKLFALQTIDRFGFDFEILFLAQRYGYAIKEIPVHWVNQPGSKVKGSDYFKTLLELFKIRWNDLRGVYPATVR